MAEKFIKMKAGDAPSAQNDFSRFNGFTFTYGPNVRVGRTVQVRVATSQRQSRNWDRTINPGLSLIHI